jgi:hypothetical protein
MTEFFNGGSRILPLWAIPSKEGQFCKGALLKVSTHFESFIVSILYIVHIPYCISYIVSWSLIVTLFIWCELESAAIDKLW